jgi:hypothetical protein
MRQQWMAQKTSPRSGAASRAQWPKRPSGPDRHARDGHAHRVVRAHCLRTMAWPSLAGWPMRRKEVAGTSTLKLGEHAGQVALGGDSPARSVDGRVAKVGGVAGFRWRRCTGPHRRLVAGIAAPGKRKK